MRKTTPKKIEPEPDGWTTAKQELLEEQEGIIENGKAAFDKVASALLIIKTEGLYLKTHINFGDYCRERFGFGKQWAYKLLRVAEVDVTLDRVAQGDSKKVQAGIEKLKEISDKGKLELAGLKPKTLKKIAKDIEEVPTAKEVKKIVAKVRHVAIPEEDEDEEPKCGKCGKKLEGPTADWVADLVCTCDNRGAPKLPEVRPLNAPTPLDTHPILVAMDNEWVNIQRGLAYGNFTPVQIYQKLRTAVEKAIVTK